MTMSGRPVPGPDPAGTNLIVIVPEKTVPGARANQVKRRALRGLRSV